MRGWISTKFQLPPHGKEVLCSNPAWSNLRIGWWDKELKDTSTTFVVYGAKGTRQDSVAWWMELPSVPSEEKHP